MVLSGYPIRLISSDRCHLAPKLPRQGQHRRELSPKNKVVSTMEQLAAAAAEADPAAQPAAQPAAEPAAGDGQPAEAAADASAAPDGAAAADDAKPKGTRKRGLEKMEADLVELRVKIAKNQNVISSAMGLASLTKAQRESLDKARNNLTRLSALVTAKS